MSKEIKKTNFDYLREILKGNEEGIEFLDAIKKEYDAQDETITSLEDDVQYEKEQVSSRDSEILDLEEKFEYSGRINTNMGAQGDIRWQTDNISCQSMMEELDNAISRGISIVKIENVLRAI